MNILEEIEPKKVFKFFEEISCIPRESRNEKEISDYLVDFAVKHKFSYNQDEEYNVVIYKPASKGFENSLPVILQGHIDMVCEKNKNTMHDFMTDPLKLFVEDDFVKAKGTTLGADNGIAVAYMLAILDCNDILHPPIEAVFTSNEETGMDGAKALDPSLLKGRRLINLDTEEEGSLLVSCCGGVKYGLRIKTTRQACPAGFVPYEINISGLKGGHSGTDIVLQRANAIKLLGRTLKQLNDSIDLYIADVSGGGKDNAIARESSAVVMIKQEDINKAQEILNKIHGEFIHEYKSSENNINISFSSINEKIPRVFEKSTALNVISILLLIPQGINTMSLEINGLVESSSNIGILKTKDDYIFFESAVRSSVPSLKKHICEKIDALAILTEGETYSFGDYPSWEFNKNSKLLKIFTEVYKDMYKKEPLIEAVHAGLECGLFAEKLHGIDMISIGPDIKNVHSPDEMMSISSVKRVWEYLLEVLKRLK